MITKYNLYKESLLNKIEGPSKEDIRNNFFNNEYNLNSAIKSFNLGAISIIDVVNKLDKNSTLILQFLGYIDNNFLNNIPFEELINYGLTPTIILISSIKSDTIKPSNPYKINKKIFILSLNNGAKLEHLPRYMIYKLLETSEEGIIKNMLEYFINNKIYHCLLSAKANEHIINDCPKLLKLRDEYMIMCNENNNLINSYNDFFDELPNTPVDFLIMINNNIKIIKRSSSIEYYYGKKLLFYKPYYSDEYIYIRKIISDILLNYYKLNGSDEYLLLKEYITDNGPIHSKLMIWDEKLFRQYDNKI